MNENNKKIVTLGFVAGGATAFIVTRVLFESLAVSVGFVGKYWSQTQFQHGIPVVVGVLFFVVLQLNKGFNSWGEEVVVEIKKVVWPSKKDTIAMTIVCCVMLIFAGITLGVFDLASKYSLDWFLAL